VNNAGVTMGRKNPDSTENFTETNFQCSEEQGIGGTRVQSHKEDNSRIERDGLE